SNHVPNTLQFPVGLAALCPAIQWWLADVNGDGLDDLVVLADVEHDPGNHSRTAVFVYLNQGPGGGYFGQSTPGETAVIADPLSTLAGVPGDVDGDGHIGLVCLYPPASGQAVQLITVRWRAQGGAGLDVATDSPPGLSWQPSESPPEIRLADLNGD